MRKTSEDILASYIDALRPIIYINNFDKIVVDKTIESIAQGVNIVEFDNALGALAFKTKTSMMECDLEHFLKTCREDGFEQETFILLRDIHNHLEDSKIIALLKRIAEDNIYNQEYRCTVFIVSSIIVIPVELENYITIFDVPLPTSSEIMEIMEEHIKELGIIVPQDILNDIALSFKGLNEFQIKQILNLAYQDGGRIDAEASQLIVKEKEQFIKKSGMLEVVNFKETIDDIGGLEKLKEWLENKAEIFKHLDEAIKFGVDIPKGIMIIGMPGCGKSLAAKATADLFQIPLIRFDIGRLLGKYVGESEENMRKALKLAEAISPCVLWIDEIEKAFSGIGGSGGGSDVTTRLFGQFLTWMQEKENAVFIVATANDVSKMPPEFLRKGRFDELFFVDLPNSEERKKILEIHLKKRKKLNKKDIKIISLIRETEGFSGADLETVVKDTIEKAFIRKRKESLSDSQVVIKTEHLREVIKDTESISVTLKDKIEQIRETLYKIHIKPASTPKI